MPGSRVSAVSISDVVEAVMHPAWLTGPDWASPACREPLIRLAETALIPAAEPGTRCADSGSAQRHTE